MSQTGPSTLQCWLLSLVLPPLVLSAPAAHAGDCGDTAGHETRWAGFSRPTEDLDKDCLVSLRCYRPITQAPYFALTPAGCDPQLPPGCTVEMRVPVKFPGLQKMIEVNGLGGSTTPSIFWTATATAPPCTLGLCGGRERRERLISSPLPDVNHGP